MKKYNFLLAIILGTLSVSSCGDDLDDIIRPSANIEIADFIYRGLNYWSIYKEDVPDLANDRFASDEERLDFLSQFATPRDAFNGLLSPRDRFSILSDNFEEFENALAGIRLSTGMRFSLFRQPQDQSLVFGVVRFVFNDGPARDAGVRRGMIFTGIDGSPLTEVSDLGAIFAQPSFSIDLATFDEGNQSFTTTGESISLDQVELSINPVHIAQTLTIKGQNIGYLHYTGFTNEFDQDLNAAFGQFQANGISELVLDLRHNGGGSIETANDLSSMITGQFEGQTFISQRFNEDRDSDFASVRTFNNTIRVGQDGTEQINSLGLTRVFVLTTNNTASASELILSGLDPYIDIVQIGTTTSGKFEGSFLVYDTPAPPFFRRQEANLGHRFVMLPLVLRSVNADGLTDYFDGFFPDIELPENVFNLVELGDPSEPLLAAAINEILAGRSPIPTPEVIVEPLFESDQNDLLYQRMITE